MAHWITNATTLVPQLPDGPPSAARAFGTMRSALLGVGLLSAASNVLMLAGPLFMMQVYDRVLPSRSLPTLVVLTGMVIGVYLFIGLIELIRSRVLTRLGQKLDQDLASRCFRAALDLPLTNSRPAAALQPLRDLDQIRQFMSGPGPIAIFDLPWIPFYLAIIFALHVWLGVLATAGALVLVLITLLSEFGTKGVTARAASLGARRQAMVDAGRRNAEAIRAMGMAEDYEHAWRETNARYLAEQGQAADVTGGYSAASKMTRMLLQSAVLALGAGLALLGDMSPGAMIAASIVVSRALSPVELAIAHWRGFVTARQSWHHLTEAFTALGSAPPPLPLPAPCRDVTVQGLTVVPPGSPAPTLADVSFTIRAGEALGVIGPSGSGKSTLARALVGAWQPLRGTVRLDGAELSQWTPERLGRSIGYMPQDIDLFDGTVAQNIARFDRSLPQDAVVAAAMRAGAHEMIVRLPAGYDTWVGPVGNRLSAGQRQRIALARALYGEPFLIVLDEPNSNLDTEGEMALTSAIRGACGHGAAVMVIAHRRSAIAAVDHVLVLNKGRVAALGSKEKILRAAASKPAEKPKVLATGAPE